MATDRLSGRNGEIWKAYCRGSTQERIADKYGITQQRVQQIIKEVSNSIPEQTREELIRREADFLNEIREQLVEIALKPPSIKVAPNGKPIPNKDGGPATDDSERMAAMRDAVKTTELFAKMFGLNAPDKVQTDGTQTVKYTIEGVDVEKFLK